MSQGIGHLERYYRLKPNGIIHVGANKGQEVEAYRESGIRPVVLIEPLPEAFTALLKAVDGEVGFFPVQACCDATGDRVVDFHVSTGDGQSSSYLKPTGHLDVAPYVKFDQVMKLKTSTLDEVVAELGKTQAIDVYNLDYLAIDTQGAERDVLIGAKKTLAAVKFVWLEVTFGSLYAEDCNVYQMIKFMRMLGFDLYHLLIGRQPWGDALFIREGILTRGSPSPLQFRGAKSTPDGRRRGPKLPARSPEAKQKRLARAQAKAKQWKKTAKKEMRRADELQRQLQNLYKKATPTDLT
jgi:FkbM family methyltransferase